jgi:hemerythrin-like domain-containing protein
MKTYQQAQQQAPAELGIAHMNALSEAMERLKQEHAELKLVLQEMEKQAVHIEASSDKQLSLQSLLHLRLWTLAFREELERHSNWEEEELFPFLNIYFNSNQVTSMAISICSIEKEHELAEQHIQSFLRAVHMLKANPEAISLDQAAAFLVHACRILQEHLVKEEEIFFPVAERILMDLDCLYS